MTARSVESLSSDEEGSAHRSTTCCGKIPEKEVIYFCQVILIYIVVIACLLNLILGSGLEALWSSLLSGSVGYLLPGPSICKREDESLVHNSSQQQLTRLLSKQHDDSIHDPTSVDVLTER